MSSHAEMPQVQQMIIWIVKGSVETFNRPTIDILVDNLVADGANNVLL